jgi:hypothetical protein
MRYPCCLCLRIPHINFWRPESILMKLVGNWANLKGVLHKCPLSTSLCVCICISPLVARQRLGKHVPTAANTLNNRRTLGFICLRVCLGIPLLLFCNNSAHMFLRQRRIVWDVVFYAVYVVWKESRRLDIPRTSYLFFLNSTNRMVNICFLWDRNWKCNSYLVHSNTFRSFRFQFRKILFKIWFWIHIGIEKYSLNSIWY